MHKTKIYSNTLFASLRLLRETKINKTTTLKSFLNFLLIFSTKAVVLRSRKRKSAWPAILSVSVNLSQIKNGKILAGEILKMTKRQRRKAIKICAKVHISNAY